MRLTSDEAFALTVALRALAELPGPGGRGGGALGAGQAGGRRRASLDRAAPTGPTRSGWCRPIRRRRSGLVRQALDETRRIWIRYYTASRDAVTERTVDPLRLLVTDGHAYLEAYCHLAGAIRHFRVDRIEEVRLLDEPAQATLWVDSDIPERIFHPDPQIPPVTLTLTGGARWVAEYYPMEEITELAGTRPVRCGCGCARPATSGWPGWCSRSAARPVIRPARAVDVVAAPGRQALPTIARRTSPGELSPVAGAVYPLRMLSIETHLLRALAA